MSVSYKGPKGYMHQPSRFISFKYPWNCMRLMKIIFHSEYCVHVQELKIVALDLQEKICCVRNILVIGDFMKNNFGRLSAFFQLIF